MVKKKSAITAAAAVITAAAMMCTYSGAEKNNDKITVKINGQTLDFDVQPCIMNGRTMVPMRTIFEALGAEISWDESSKTITAKKNNDTITLEVGKYELYKNKSASAIDSPAVIENGRTLVPVRAVSDALDVDISWEDESKTVNISTEDESDEEWKNNTGEINLDSMAVSGSGVTAEGNIIKITQGGDFTVTGTLTDGMIYISTDSKVKLRLNNASITNSCGPAIFFENSKKGYITITKGSENYLSDSSAAYTVDAKAVLFSNDDLKISGSGTLNITANQNHAIASDDKIDIDEGTILAVSANDGIHANEDITISNASVSITADGDGIQSESALTVSNADIDITTKGESDSDNTFIPNNAYSTGADSDSTSVSSKGLKTETTLTVTSGNITINSTDHAIHSADKILIHGGNFEITSQNGKGISGHGDVTINNGDINIIKSTEGIESKAVLTVNDGNVNIVSSDDGMNAGGGTSMGGQGGGMPSMRPDENGSVSEIPQGNMEFNTITPSLPQDENGFMPEPPQENIGKGGRSGNMNQPNSGNQKQKVTDKNSDMSKPSQGNTEFNNNMPPMQQGENGFMPASPQNNMGKGGRGGENMNRPDINSSYTASSQLNMDNNSTRGNSEQKVTDKNNNIPKPSPDSTDNSSGNIKNTAQPTSPSKNNISEENTADDTEHTIIINGGNITIDAVGDSIDSNGNLFINGGNITILGTTRGGDGILDCGDFNSGIYINGGTLIASGTSSMYEAPSAESEQNSVSIFLTSAATEGTGFFITDEN